MSHYEHNRGCWMFKPPSTGKQGGLLAAINKLSKSWSKRWVWITHDALHYAPKRPSNPRSEDNIVRLDTVLDVRAVDAKFMMKKGVPPDVADFGWILRTEKKDILWAAPDPDTRDRVVAFFAKYRAWCRIGQPEDEEDAVAFYRTQLFEERDLEDFSETSSHFGAQSSMADYDKEGNEYWDEMMADEGGYQQEEIDMAHEHSLVNDGGRASPSSNSKNNRSEQTLNESSPSRPIRRGSFVSHGSPTGIAESDASPPGSTTFGSNQDLESMPGRRSSARVDRPVAPRPGTPPTRSDTQPATQRRRAAAQTMHFGRARPDSVVKIAEQSSGDTTRASTRSAAPPIGGRQASAPPLDHLDEWDDIDGTLVALKSSSTILQPGDEENGKKTVRRRQELPQWPSEGPIVRISETQQLLRQRIEERNKRRENGGGSLALSLAGLALNEVNSELGSASPSPRAFAMLLQRKPRDFVTTTRCAESSRTPLVLPLESVEEFACLAEDVTFLDRQDNVVGRACGTTEGLVIRKTGVIDDAKFAACVRILFQCEQLHPQLHEPTQVTVESVDGTQTMFSTEFGAYVIAQVVQRSGGQKK